MKMITSLLIACAAVLVVAGLVAWNTFNGSTWHNPTPSMTSFYDLQAETLEGEAF